jgi:hypothetical protein
MPFTTRFAKTLRVRIATVAGLIALVAAMSPWAAQAQFLHPKINSKQSTIRNVVILPAKVQIVRDSMKGPEGMAAESEQVSERVEKMLSEVLAKKHVTTLSGPAASSSEDSAQQKYTVADLQSKFDDLLPKVMKKRSDVKKGRFTMGDEVLNLNLDKNADAIIFIRGQGQKLSSGKKTFVLLVGGAPAYLKLMIGVVDARNGEVLLYTDPILVGDPTTAIDRLRSALEKGLKKLPGVPQ